MRKLLVTLSLFSKLSLLSILMVTVSCKGAQPPVDDTVDKGMANESQEGEKASGEDKDQAGEANVAVDTAKALCFDEDATFKSVQLKTDLFYKGALFEDSYGNTFLSHNSEFALMLSDDFSVTEFSVHSDDEQVLVSSGELSEAQVRDASFVKFLMKADLSFTTTQKDFFSDLSGEEQQAFLEYEFEQMFDTLKGDFKLHVNDKAFYSSDDKSLFSYTISNFSSLEEAGSTEEAAEGEAEVEETASVELLNQGSRSATTEETMTAEAGESEESTEDSMSAESTETAESETAGEGEEAEATEMATTAEEAAVVDTLTFTFTATVSYEVDAEALQANETFASLTTCQAEETTEEAGEGEAEEATTTTEAEAGESEESTEDSMSAESTETAESETAESETTGEGEEAEASDESGDSASEESTEDMSEAADDSSTDESQDGEGE